jgi:uncharacterized protein (TIGR03067 family)
MRPLLAVALLVGFAPAAPVPKTLKKLDDHSLLMGKWKTTSEQGQKGAAIWTHTYQFEEGGLLKQWYGPKDSCSQWDWAIDPEQTPKTMTWVNRQDPKSAYDCTYEVDGDTLRLNYVGAKQPLPKGVGPKAGGYAIEMTRHTSAK